MSSHQPEPDEKSKGKVTQSSENKDSNESTEPSSNGSKNKPQEKKTKWNKGRGRLKIRQKEKPVKGCKKSRATKEFIYVNEREGSVDVSCGRKYP